MPTFASTVPGRTPADVATSCGARDRGLARRLLRDRDHEAARVEGDGAVRAGFVHYNTPDEVDRLLDGGSTSCADVDPSSSSRN